jgi:hypothetical protein
MSTLQRCILNVALACVATLFTIGVVCAGGGISGTGRVAYGSITAFGSVFVNGVEYSTSSANIIISGQTNWPESELKLGMAVRVEGTANPDGRTGTATTVEYIGDIKGTIDGAPVVTAGGGRFTVYGLVVRTDSKTVFEDVEGFASLAAGDLVEVAGLIDAKDSSFLATRVEKKTSVNVYELRGYISNVTPTTFVLGPSLVVNYSTAQRRDFPAGGLTNGLYVEVKATNPPASNVLTATRVSVEGSALASTNIPFGLLQGIPAKVSGAIFAMGNQPIVTDAQTVFIGGSIAALAGAPKALASGPVVNGIMTAEKVVIGNAAAVVGDLSGDGVSELLVQFGANGETSGLFRVGTTWFGIPFESGGTGWSIAHIGDFNGDGMTDLLWRNTNGATTLWLMNGASVLASAGLLPPGAGWSVSHVGDFDGDGNADLLWRNDADGAVTAWLMDGITVKAAPGLLGGGSGWRVSHVGDMNGDGKANLLWRNDASGAVTQWLMNGEAVTSAVGLLGGGSGWRVTHLVDFNGDGMGDLLWRKDADGAVTSWLMNGATVTAAAGLLAGNTGWRVGPVGDLDGDGKADLIWRNESLALTNAWLMNGVTVAQAAPLLADPAWRLVQLRDLNGDGKLDFVWRNERSAAGTLVVDYMNGLQKYYGEIITGPGNRVMP